MRAVGRGVSPHSEVWAHSDFLPERGAEGTKEPLSRGDSDSTSANEKVGLTATRPRTVSAPPPAPPEAPRGQAVPGPRAPSRRIENHASPGRQRGPRCTAASVPCDCDVVTHKSNTTCEAPHSQQVFGSSGLRGQSGSQGLTQPTTDSWSQRPPLSEGLVPRTVPTSAANRTSGPPDP